MLSCERRDRCVSCRDPPPRRVPTSRNLLRYSIRKRRPEKRRRRGVARGDDFGRAFGDDFAAVGAGVGANLDQPVGGFEDVEIVFDDDDAVSVIDERLKDGEETFDVVAVQAGGGFVEEEQGSGGSVLQLSAGDCRCSDYELTRRWRRAAEAAKIAHEFEALRFAAAEGVERLAEGEIAEADGVERWRAGE